MTHRETQPCIVKDEFYPNTFLACKHELGKTWGGQQFSISFYQRLKHEIRDVKGVINPYNDNINYK